MAPSTARVWGDRRLHSLFIRVDTGTDLGQFDASPSKWAWKPEALAPAVSPGRNTAFRNLHEAVQR